jgi:hypothetical protein
MMSTLYQRCYKRLGGSHRIRQGRLECRWNWEFGELIRG